MTAILTALQHQGPSRETYHIMLPPSYSDHDPLPPPSFDPLSLMLIHYPIVKRFASFITTGDLIQLSRTSSTLRETLLQSPEYWNGLLSLTSLVCSENTHIKGDNVKNCVLCSMPICETCIVKSDFHGTSGTFTNRIRTFCDSCWSATEFSHPPNSPHSTAPPVCLCVAKDGWLCSRCRASERDELEENKYTCATDGCYNPHNSSEKQRVCTWCRLPLPPSWRPATVEQSPIQTSSGRNSNGFPDEEAPVYEEGERRLSNTSSSPGNKQTIAGWDQMSQEERESYKSAWLQKGARERARGAVFRSPQSGADPAPLGDPYLEEVLKDFIDVQPPNISKHETLPGGSTIFGAGGASGSARTQEAGEASGSSSIPETGETNAGDSSIRETAEASGSGSANVEVRGNTGNTDAEDQSDKLKLKGIDRSEGSS